MAIVERFASPSGSGNGLDPNGFGLTAGDYDDTGHGDGDYRLYESGAFSGYTHGTDPAYIYLSGGAGITPGLYQIASKVSNDVILLTSSAGADSTGDVTSDADGPYDLPDAITALSAGQRLNIFGSHSSSDVSISASSTNASPIWIEGFGVTIRDGIRAIIDMGAGTFSFTGDALKITHLEVTGSDPAATVVCNGDNNLLYNCKITNTGTGNNNYYALNAAHCDIVRCYLSSTTGGSDEDDAALKIDNCNVYGCYIFSTHNCIYADFGSVANNICNNIIEGSGAGSVGIWAHTATSKTESCSITNNTFYNCSDEFIQFPGTPDIGDQGGMLICNNVAHTSTSGYGVDHSGDENTTMNVVCNGAWNTADATYFLSTAFGDMQGVYSTHIECTGDPCIAPGSGDFSLNATAGAGADLKGACISNDLSSWPFNLAADNYRDVGGVHNQAG